VRAAISRYFSFWKLPGNSGVMVGFPVIYLLTVGGFFE